MYDPNNPNPSVPDGMMATTSIPASGGGFGGAKPPRPGVPEMPTSLPAFKPPVPSQGTQIAQNVFGAPVGAPNLTAPVTQGTGSGGFGGGFDFSNMFSNLPGNLGGTLGAYMNSLFSWLNQRPDGRDGRTEWRAQMPSFSDFRSTMLNPPPAATTPAPVAGIAVGEPNPAAVSGLGI